MKNINYLIATVLIIIFIYIGIFNTYNFWFNSKIDKTFIEGLISFYSFGLSSLLLSSLTTYIFFVPKGIKYSILTVFYIEKIKNEVGISKAKKIKNVDSVLFILFAALICFCLVSGLNIYEKYQLTNFGEKQEIEISNSYKSWKEFQITNIKYKYKGKFYQKELFVNNYKTKEKVEIIFSTKDPRIAIWYDEFKMKGK